MYSLHEMPQNLVDGWHCFLGYRLSGYECDESSPSSAFLLLIYVVANWLYNIAVLKMVKHGSAVALVIASAMALPISNVAFTLRFIMGEDTEEMSLYNLLGLGLVVIGFLCYSLVPDVETGEFIVPTGTCRNLTYMRIYDEQRDERMYSADSSVLFMSLLLTGAAGHNLFVTEVLPSAEQHPPKHRRRHSFDFHNSPSIRSLQARRKERMEQKLKQKQGTTPSRTP